MKKCVSEIRVKGFVLTKDLVYFDVMLKASIQKNTTFLKRALQELSHIYSRYNFTRVFPKLNTIIFAPKDFW